MGDLTDKQRRFVEEYVVDFNAAGAARRAGYSENSAREMGHENLTKPHITERINERLEKFEHEAHVTKAMVVSGLLQEAHNADSDSARVSAWKELGRHLGMFTDNLDVEGDVSVSDLTIEVLDRRRDE